MPRFRESIPIDDYILDVLMRDLIGHDQQPAAYLVYSVGVRLRLARHDQRRRN